MATSVSDQIRQIERMYGDNKYPQPIGAQNASNGGMNRVAPNVPTAIPRVLPLGLPENGQPKQNAPIPQAQPVTPSPVSSRPSNPVAQPNVPPSLGQRLGSAANNASNGLNRVGGAVAGVAAVAQTAGAVGNAIRNPNQNNLVNTGLDLASNLVLLPNPYAKAAGLLAIGAKLLYNVFRPPENLTNALATPSSQPFTGGQSPVQYYINFSVVQPSTGRTYTESENQLGIFGPVSLLTIQMIPINAGGAPYATILARGFDSVGAPFNLSRVISNLFPDISVTVLYLNLVRADGQSDESSTGDQVPSQNQDGYSKPDFDKAFDDLKDRFSGVDSNLDSIKDLLANLKQNQLPRANNGVTPIAPNRVPKPLPKPKLTPDAEKISNPVSTPKRDNVPQGLKAPQPSATPTSQPNKAPQPSTAPSTALRNNPSTSPKTNPDRFKDPKDCKFSCSALADCFGDLTVKIFDGCDPKTGLAKTKDLTIQVLPKDKAKTSANFKELLDIRSRECILNDKNDKVLTIPEYWQLRVNQVPQAVILYREFLDNKFTDTYYSSHIPHYTGSKNSKPRLTQYNKGEHSAIYVCKDNSKLVVYGESEQEAKRIINEMERYINPRLRGNIVKLGTRKGIKETTVKPIRIDFFSTGQTKLTPDWSIPL